MRPLYPSNTQVDYNQSSSRSSLSRARKRRGSRTGQTHRSHTSSASLQENYRKELHYNLLGVGSQFANFDSAHRYQPSLCTRAPQENQPIYEDHLYISRSSVDEYELEVLGSILDTDPVDEGKSQQQELEQREDEAHGEFMPHLLTSVALLWAVSRVKNSGIG
jgi:hypothetical protein